MFEKVKGEPGMSNVSDTKEGMSFERALEAN